MIPNDADDRLARVREAHWPQIDGDVDDSTWMACGCGWDSQTTKEPWWEHVILALPAADRAVEPVGLDVERLRSTPRTKGLMAYAVEDAWEGATSPVGDPADGIEMHNLGKLADGILDALAARLATTPAGTLEG